VPLNLNGDPGRLRQVLLNLIGNAIKFTHKGEIDVKVELAGKEDNIEHAPSVSLRFAVRDTGIGIPSDKTNLLFNSFSQVDASLARKYGGTGLGLAISKGLVEQMGGSIGVESAHGKGSTFWFIIPFLNTLQRPALVPLTDSGKVSGQKHGHGAHKHEQYQHGKRLRILVAEDNMANQMVILGMLKKMGHSVVIAVNGQEAVRKFTDSPEDFDLIFMDVQMPEMDGLAATRSIREEGFDTIPIVAMTASAIEGDPEYALASAWMTMSPNPSKRKSSLG